MKEWPIIGFRASCLYLSKSLSKIVLSLSLNFLKPLTNALELVVLNVLTPDKTCPICSCYSRISCLYHVYVHNFKIYLIPARQRYFFCYSITPSGYKYI